MANYTIEFKDVVKHYPVFNFPYEFYDEKKRRDFEKKFIQHFYFREIGCPSVEQFLHYLKDKMDTVFPYYNQLMQTAAIEYSVLDNYNVTETFERRYENTGKTNGVSSSVGQVMDDQNTETNDKRESENKTTSAGTTVQSQKDTFNEVVDSEENGTENTDRILTGNNESDKTTENSSNQSTDERRRFLDTPQGRLTLSDEAYLTTLNHDTKNVTDEGNGSEKIKDKRTESDETETTKKNEGLRETEATRNVTGNSTQNQNVLGEDISTGNSSTVFTGNQRSTSDNNTRLERHDEHIENYTLRKKGNIGVDTDADMIQKHINLQKVLTQIEKMFFDECEDLFMLVW